MSMNSQRSKICEYCGTYIEKGNHIHHIHHRGSGGSNKKENLICLCSKCHTKVHVCNISRWDLINIVARREGKTPEDICEIIGLLIDKVKIENYVFDIPNSPLEGKSLEEVIQIYCSYSEIEETAIWEKAAILAAMIDAGIKVKTISSLVGCSPATVRERVRTFKAFPDPLSRAVDKTFTHHRIASKTKDPGKWIDLVCEMDLSTRQLEEAIKAEGQDGIIKKDILKEKAERVVRMIKEILTADIDTAQWLKSELNIILKEDISNVRIIGYDSPHSTDEVA